MQIAPFDLVFAGLKVNYKPSCATIIIIIISFFAVFDCVVKFLKDSSSVFLTFLMESFNVLMLFCPTRRRNPTFGQIRLMLTNDRTVQLLFQH